MRQGKPCPKCGVANGWFEKRILTGSQFFYPDGSPSHYYDEYSRGGKRKYCFNCGKDITKCISK